MTKEAASVRAEYFAAKAAELFFAAEAARHARCYGDAADLEGRAARATGNARAYRAEARKAA